jgi:glycosyltransferase involved in cell wall biosynthesis
MSKKSLQATRSSSSQELLSPEYTDWASILKRDSNLWQSALADAKSGRKVLIANCAGFDPHATTVESLLAVALTLRGADVHVLLCDEALPACWNLHSHKLLPEEFAEYGPSRQLCGTCSHSGSMVFAPLGLTIHRYSEFLSESDIATAAAVSASVPIDEIENFTYEGIRVGEHAFAGALRYFSLGSLQAEPRGEPALRRYLNAAMSSMFAVRRLLKAISFESVCGIHGVYVPEGIIGEVARSLNVRMVSWNDSYRKHTFIFSQYDTYHRTMLLESTSLWKDMPWTDEMDAEIREYLKSRWYGTHDWITYTQDWSDDVLSVASAMGIDFSKPCIGLLTNVIWDAQVHYGGNAFPTMLQWTLETIRYFAGRPDLQLIVRVHPAEIRGSHISRQLMVDEIKKAFPDLPKNVFVVPPDSSLNTYAAMMKCDAVVLYATKAGVELASMGIPVIVAGEAWIRNKGLTMDANTPEEYFGLLDRLPLRKRMNEETVLLAKKYAYHFFFRCHIPVPVLHEGKGVAITKLEISGLQDLSSGKEPGLDIICNGILNGDEFIYPAERYAHSLTSSGKFTKSFSAELPDQASGKPLVSVIVTTQNHAKSLTGILNSVYAQDGAGKRFDLEVILIDNASTDDTSQVARAFSGIKNIRLEKSANPAAIRNIGVRESTGKYLVFHNDDSLWSTERLLSQIPILEKYPEFGAVYGQFVATGTGEDYLWPDAGVAPAGSDFRGFAMEDLAIPSFLTLRRETLAKAGRFDESLLGIDDYDICLRLASFSPIAFVSGPVGRLTLSSNSGAPGRLRRGEYQEELQYVLSKAFALLPENSDKAELMRDVVGHWFTKTAASLARARSFEKLRSHILSFLQHRPWMMSDPEFRSAVLGYSSTVLTQTASMNSGLVHSVLRSFCRDVKGVQNGSYAGNKNSTQRFLGDTLTLTAISLWNKREFTAAALTASYAIFQDFAQIVPQVRSTSKRLRQARLTAAT